MDQDALPGLPPGVTQEWLNATFSASYSGPLPLPDHLEQYDRLVPGTAASIIDTVYRAPERRQQQALDSVTETSKRGQGWAIALAVICVVASIVFFALGNNVAGSVLLGAPLIAMLGMFLPHRKH